MVAGSALRAGAGLVTIAAGRAAADIVASHVTAVMVRATDGAAEWDALLNDTKPAAIALGSGLEPDGKTRSMVLVALASPAAVTLDAGALTAFANAPDALFSAVARRSAATVMTPHAGEYSRLFAEQPLSDATALSGATIVLKGPTTRIASPRGQVGDSEHGPPWLATAGTGDVLAGLVTGLLAQRMPPTDAAEAAVWMHGEAAHRLGPGMTADDLDAALRPVVRDTVNAAMGAVNIPTS